MPHRLVLLLAPLCALTLFGSPAAAGNRQPVGQRQTQSAHAATALEVLRLENDAKRQRQATWQWQKLMGHPLTHTPSRYLANDGSITAVESTAKFWQKQETIAHKRAQHPAHLAAWLCIHSGIKAGRWSPSLTYLGGGYHVARYGEGSWTDPNAPYYGGLQMNIGFQQAYGGRLLRSKGTADHWNAYEQMWVAEKAFASGQGFTPWPNTARACGLF